MYCPKLNDVIRILDHAGEWYIVLIKNINTDNQSVELQDIITSNPGDYISEPTWHDWVFSDTSIAAMDVLMEDCLSVDHFTYAHPEYLV